MTDRHDLNVKYHQLTTSDPLSSHFPQPENGAVSAGQRLNSPISLNSQAPSVARKGEEDDWPTLDGAAYHGLAGDVVSTVDPYTEADPAGVLLTFLASFGNVSGSVARAIAGEVPHPAKLNVLLVGDSARARKGTTQAVTNAIMRIAAPDWAKTRIMGGLSSGEGLLAAVDDSVVEEEIDGQRIELPRNPDKRLLIVEAEFGRTLTVMGRDTNTLSSIIREAWDGPDLRVLNRTNPLVATGTHISIIGHITIDELTAKMSDVDMANGFANRFLFALVRQSKELPDGGNIPTIEKNRLGTQVAHALTAASRAGTMERTPAARDLWHHVYPSFTIGPVGMLGAITARPAAQVLRLSIAYALLDRAHHVDLPHLQAALAVWRYAEQSARYIFGTEDPVTAALLDALKKAGPAGMTDNDQVDLFKRHIKKAKLDSARRALEDLDEVKATKEATGGRPRRRWFYIGVSEKSV